MNKLTMVWAVMLRLMLGWFMIFDALPMIKNPAWTSAQFLMNAKTFPGFYAWFAQPQNLVWVDPLNKWGILFIGIAFLFGVLMRPAAWAAAVMMVVYYFPHYVFPYVTYGYVIEEHIIYAVAFLLVAYLPQAQYLSLGALLRKTAFTQMPLVGRYI